MMEIGMAIAEIKVVANVSQEEKDHDSSENTAEYQVMLIDRNAAPMKSD